MEMLQMTPASRKKKKSLCCDFKGKILSVGDEVVWTNKDSDSFNEGVVSDVTELTVKVAYYVRGVELSKRLFSDKVVVV